MTEAYRDYYLGRERAERAAAESARDARVRSIHLELAERYAALASPRQRLSLHFGGRSGVTS